jgi:hypothetical protein
MVIIFRLLGNEGIEIYHEFCALVLTEPINSQMVNSEAPQKQSALVGTNQISKLMTFLVASTTPSQ